MSDVLTAVLAFFGAAIGSGLTYLATRQSTAAESEARRREEWGRRFTAALEAITSADAVSRATGRALLVELLASPLASADDRHAAQVVLDAAATHNKAGALVLPPGDVDDVEVVRETGSTDQPEGGRG